MTHIIWLFSYFLASQCLSTQECKQTYRLAPKKCENKSERLVQGCHDQGKAREKQKFCKVREKSGNFVKGQGKVRELYMYFLSKKHHEKRSI